MNLKRSFKRIVTVLSVLFVCLAILPVSAAEPSFKLEKNSFFLHPGESVTGKYTYTGSGTVEFSEPNTIENMGDVYNICTVTAGKGSFTIKAAAGNSHGRARIDVTVDGEVKETIEVFVYDTDNFYLIQPLADQAVLITYTMARIYVGTPYDVSLFMPVTVTSSDPSVAAPEKPVMPLGYLDMDLKKPGTTTITLKSEKLNGTLKLTVLPDGDYADYVTVKDDKSSLSVRVGTKTPDPFVMKSYEGTCKDDKLTVKVTENIPLVDEKDVVRLEKDGSITALNPGYAMVEAKSLLGYTGRLEVMVYSDPEKLVFEENTYYVDQNGDWLPYYPYADAQPYTCGMPPVVYTSSNDKIVKAEGTSLQYVKPGEVTIRAAYKDNPKIYTEFKVKAFTAADPESISLPKEIILYPDFAQTVPVEYTPYLSFHTISSAATADDTIAELAYYSSEGVSVNGRKPGSTTLTVKAGSKAKASAKVTVKSGKPEALPYAEGKQGRLRGGLIRAGFEDLTKGYTCILGKEYTFTYGVDYKDGYYYQGEESQIKVDLSKNLAATGLFDGGSAGTNGTTSGIYMTKAIKAGEATVEVVPGVKAKITVIDPSKVQKVSMYRLYNKNTGEHFYTAKAKEKDALVTYGWTYEGIGWTAPDKSNTPVYRLYNSSSGDHHYTMKKKERDALLGFGWKDEGIGWYSDDAKGVPLYREYNPNMDKCNHNYTTNKKEHEALTTKLGWKDEGIGWYGLK